MPTDGDPRNTSTGADAGGRITDGFRSGTRSPKDSRYAELKRIDASPMAVWIPNRPADRYEESANRPSARAATTAAVRAAFLAETAGEVRVLGLLDVANAD
jgi:hypothetical protein